MSEKVHKGLPRARQTIAKSFIRIATRTTPPLPSIIHITTPSHSIPPSHITQASMHQEFTTPSIRYFAVTYQPSSKSEINTLHGTDPHQSRNTLLLMKYRTGHTPHYSTCFIPENLGTRTRLTNRRAEATPRFFFCREGGKVRRSVRGDFLLRPGLLRNMRLPWHLTTAIFRSQGEGKEKITLYVLYLTHLQRKKQNSLMGAEWCHFSLYISEI